MTRQHRPAQPVRRRSRVPSRTAGDEGAAMMLALLTILVVAALSLAVLGTLLAQTTPTQFAQKNVRAAHAAEAGIDVALGRLRNAQTTLVAQPGVVVGDRQQLPCQPGTSEGRLEGSLEGSPGGMGYSVRVRYYTEDPATLTPAQLSTLALQCAPTGGGPALTPAYAVITSEGTGDGVPRRDDTLGDRTLETTYKFQLTNANVSGGLISTFPDGRADTRNLCWDAGSDAPAPNTGISLQNCSPGAPSQLWSWRPDSTIVLSVTQNANGGNGMCVTGSAASQAANQSVPLQLRPCSSGFNQKWGFTDNARFAGRLNNTNLTSNTAPGLFCIYPETENLVGTALRAGTSQCTDGTNYNRARTWRPDARVGAGKAGAISGNPSGQQFQWVNFYEFGRCFDVTNWTWNYDYMIAWPCKQDVNGYVGWNQTLQWDDDANRWLYTYSGSNGQTFNQARNGGSTRRCLTAPTTNGGRVVLQACRTNEPRHRWQVNRERGTYAESYTIEDVNGRCLSLGPPGAASGDLAQWSTIITETCDGGARQKWNAPPDAAPTALRDMQEITAP